MLLRFTVENFRSIAEKQTFDLGASRYFKEMLETNSFSVKTNERNLPRVLRSAGIYGANASGKSTLALSLAFVRWFVVEFFKHSQAGETIPFDPFRLSSFFIEEDTVFELIFLEKSRPENETDPDAQEFIRYQYGFRLNRRRVTEEWLIAYPHARPQRWFHRRFDAEKNIDRYQWGPAFRGGRLREVWKNQTRDNALFLSTAVQLNNEQLKPVFFWFSKRLVLLNARSISEPFPAISRLESEGADKIRSFLKDLDLSIDGIRIVRHPFSPEEIPDHFPAELREKMIRDMAGKEMKDLEFLHPSADGKDLVPFRIDDESDGTRNLFSFSAHWLNMLEKDQILVIDEIDTSLHPLVVRRLIELLHQSRCKAQLIFTTHDSSLLSSGILRRDQIWFVEKNRGQATVLYPLSDFSVQKEEALEKRYLSGRYGAVPFFRTSD